MKTARCSSTLATRPSSKFMRLRRAGCFPLRWWIPTAPATGPLAGFLQAQGVDTLVCGGIGGGAKTALAQTGIQLYGGVTGSAEQAVEDLLAGRLVFLPDVLCSHHGEGHGEGHSCGSTAVESTGATRKENWERPPLGAAFFCNSIACSCLGSLLFLFSMEGKQGGGLPHAGQGEAVHGPGAGHIQQVPVKSPCDKSPRPPGAAAPGRTPGLWTSGWRAPWPHCGRRCSLG